MPRKASSSRTVSKKNAAPAKASRAAAPRFDAVTLQVLWTRLITIVNEAAAALARTSFSTLVREAYDFSCIITDDKGQGLAQPPGSIPAFIGTLPATVKHFLDVFPVETLRPGDILITNDPWKGTGHLADVSVAKPIFHKGKVVAFAASVAHAPDMGGRTGSTESRDVYEEGFQIPAMRFCAGGKPDQTFLKILEANVRSADEVVGDLWAQVSALEVIEKRLLPLMRQYKLESLREVADDIHARSEKAMRTAIRAVPDGTYPYEFQTDGLLDTPVTIRIAITVKGDELEVDYEGTSPQAHNALNSAYCYTYAYTMYGLKCVLSPEVPNNEGAFRPVRVKAPVGSIVNHQFPNSGCSRVMIGHYLPFAVLGALGQVIPQQVMAGPGSPIWSVLMRGKDMAGRPFSNKIFFNGGVGANHRADGLSTMAWPSNVSLTPAEVLEQLTPCRVVSKQLRPDSGGAGQFRGGLGQDILLENRSAHPMVLAFLAERTKQPAPGLAGGKDGELGSLLIDGEPVDPKRQHILQPGGRILMRTPGGGGYGSPDRRAADAIARDRRLAFTAAGAKR
ncbi:MULTISPECIES: hydantoinase B/oxoprolinase family protein [Ramlibacter]|nr:MULTISPECIES: hydantoinase B/oxoprolinase family protein [Ramlibacter]MBA2965020.1 hydantoinase B/oxoprolinase family protein [Ramlibacter sp. CGMCC 1.13660]